MKAKLFLKTGLFLFLTTLVLSCSKSDDNPITPAPATDSREVRYEVTGNATGIFEIIYITGSNTGAAAIPTSLPWTKDIVAQPGPFAATINATVSGATPGKTITARIYVGGVLKKEQTETVLANGAAIIGSLQYVLK